MSNPLTEARKALTSTDGALRCVIPRRRAALQTIKPVARPPSRQGAPRSPQPASR